jgi:HlyD family secretion protein
LAANKELALTVEIGNSGKIIRLAPEGSYVKKSQLLAQFDKTPFLEDIERNKTDLERAKAELVQAQEDLKTEKARIDQNIKKGEDEIPIAELDLKDLQEGAGPLKIKKAKAAVDKAKSEYERLERDYKDFKELVKDGYVSQAEVDKTGTKRDEAQSDYGFAQAEYDNLVNFAYPSELEAAKAKVRSVKESYEKLKETAQYSVSSKEAAVARANANIASAQSKLTIAETQLQHSEIYSPLEGFVIYPEFFIIGSTEKRKVQIGDSVFPTQAFMQIPDTSQMMVETQIREVDIYKVKSGQETIIRVDAYPDLIMKGKVTLLGTLAEGREKEGAGGKYFNLQILLEGTDQRLRPGMTARVEVLVDEEKEALMVPVEAVFQKGSRKVSYVINNRGKIEEREILTDKSNEDFVVVRNGLSEGERVLLLDPAKELSTFDRESGPSPSTAIPAATTENPKTEEKKIGP